MESRRQTRRLAEEEVTQEIVTIEREVSIPLDHGVALATWSQPGHARGVIVFAHGSGSSRRSVRNRFVAGFLQEAGYATLLLDLLTAEEEETEALSGYLRFDIDLLANRLFSGISWVQRNDGAGLPLGLFGASTGAAAALRVAAERTDVIRAVVSRGGRPDLAGENLRRVVQPVLLIVGGDDDIVLTLNERAMSLLPGQKGLVVVPGASHLFEEPGALENVAAHARVWFDQFLVEAPAVVVPQ
jgi:dienelactone hydrolase